MGSVRRNAAGPASFTVHCVLAALLGVGSCGCAGLGSFRSSDYPLFGGFWDYGKSAEVAPGSDSYVQQLTEARERAAARQADAEKLKSKGPKDAEKSEEKAKDQAPKLEPLDDPAKPDDPEKPAEAKPRTNASTARGDANAIRVTLGRPESLPMIAGMPRRSAQPNAMAKGSNGWRREGADDRTVVSRDTRPAEIAPARVAVRETPEPADEQIEDRPVAVRDPRPAGKGRGRAASRDLVASIESGSRPDSARTDEELKDEILGQAKARLESLSAYQVEMSRVERVGGKLQPKEEVLLSVRRQPKAVRLQWENGPNKGREVIYSTSVDDRMIHVNMANSALPLPRMAIPVDSPLIMRNSRHSIREAGFDTIIEHMSAATSGSNLAGSSGGKVTYGGLIKSETAEDARCHRFVRVAPNGEKWEVLLDERTFLPRSVVAQDARGELLERYTYRGLRENPIELTSADAFDPDSRWGKSRGLFSRLAGAAASNLGGGTGSTTTTR